MLLQETLNARSHRAWHMQCSVKDRQQREKSVKRMIPECFSVAVVKSIYMIPCPPSLLLIVLKKRLFCFTLPITSCHNRTSSSRITRQKWGTSDSLILTVLFQSGYVSITLENLCRLIHFPTGLFSLSSYILTFGETEWSAPFRFYFSALEVPVDIINYWKIPLYNIHKALLF